MEKTLTKVPPQNLEAEIAVLGSILLNNTVLLKTIDIGLLGEDFYDERHKNIYKSMLLLYEKNVPVDALTLVTMLEDEKLLNKCGGSTYISEISQNVYTTANVDYYIRIILEKASLRRLIFIGKQAIENSFEGKKDANEIMETVEKGIFEISNRQKRSDYDHIKDILNDTIEVIEKNTQHQKTYTGIPSGFSDLDEYTSGFQKSDLIIVAARPSMGKTAFALSMAAQMAINHKKTIGFFSLEMNKRSLGMRLLCSIARVDSKRVRQGYVNKDEIKNIARAAEKLYHTNIMIDDTPDINILELRSKVRRMSKEFGLDIIFLDYLQLMGTRDKTIPKHEQIANISKSLKSLAREMDIPIIALSQLSRKVEERQSQMPMLSDLRESGAIEQDADLVIFIHRDKNQQKDTTDNFLETDIIIGKQRNGPIGAIKLSFLPSYTRFESFDPHNYQLAPDDNAEAISVDEYLPQ